MSAFHLSTSEWMKVYFYLLLPRFLFLFISSLPNLFWEFQFHWSNIFGVTPLLRHSHSGLTWLATTTFLFLGVCLLFTLISSLHTVWRYLFATHHFVSINDDVTDYCYNIISTYWLHKSTLLFVLYFYLIKVHVIQPSSWSIPPFIDTLLQREKCDTLHKISFNFVFVA